jgi:hypothetical protein
MSVQMNQYLGYGYLLPYKDSRKVLEEKHSEDRMEAIFDKYHDSAFKKEMVEVDGCSMIVDGMNGKYIFFGKVFNKSEVHEPLDTTTMPKVSTKIKKSVEEQLTQIFGTNFNLKPGVILLTHYR